MPLFRTVLVDSILSPYREVGTPREPEGAPPLWVIDDFGAIFVGLILEDRGVIVLLGVAIKVVF
jgi:hypothetical protein